MEGGRISSTERYWFALLAQPMRVMEPFVAVGAGLPSNRSPVIHRA